MAPTLAQAGITRLMQELINEILWPVGWDDHNSPFWFQNYVKRMGIIQVENQRQKDLSTLRCFIIFNHALELIVSGMELFPNNLELPFLIIFYVSHVGKKAKFFVIQST